MNSRDEHFRPESVEEQINNLPQTGPQSEDTTPDAHMLKDLRHVYRSYTQSGERVWERLARHITDETDIVYITDLDEATAHEGNDPFANWQAQTWRSRDNGRSRQMKLATDQTNMPGHAAPSRLALIAAGLVVALLVSSLLLVLHITRSTQIEGEPSTSHGIYLFKKDGIDKVDLQTRKVLWHLAHTYQGIDPMNPVFSPQAEVLGENLYLLDKTDTIMAINAQNGKMRWSHIFPKMGDGPQLTLSGGLVYVNAYAGLKAGRPVQQKVLYGLDPATGTIKATLTLPGTAWLDTANFDNNVLYYMDGFGSSSGITAEVYAIQLPGGKPLWHTSISVKSANMDDGPYVHNGMVYVTFHVLKSRDWIYAFDSHTGKFLGKYSIPSTGNGLRSLSFIGDMIYGPSTDGHVYALNVRTGKLVWKQSFNATIILTTPDVLYLHASMHVSDDSFTYVVALRAKDGTKLWQESVAGRYFGYSGTILNLNGVLYDLALDNPSSNGVSNGAIYALRASDGKPLWHFPVAGQEVIVA